MMKLVKDIENATRAFTEPFVEKFQNTKKF